MEIRVLHIHLLRSAECGFILHAYLPFLFQNGKKSSYCSATLAKMKAYNKEHSLFSLPKLGPVHF